MDSNCDHLIIFQTNVINRHIPTWNGSPHQMRLLLMVDKVRHCLVLSRHACIDREVLDGICVQLHVMLLSVNRVVSGLTIFGVGPIAIVSMRLTHKKTVISHKLCTHLWSSKLSHKKDKKDKTEWFTHRFK